MEISLKEYKTMCDQKLCTLPLIVWGTVIICLSTPSNRCSAPCNLTNGLSACMFKCSGVSNFVGGMTVNVSSGPGWYVGSSKMAYAKMLRYQG